MKGMTDFRYYLLKESVNRETLVENKQWLFCAPNMMSVYEEYLPTEYFGKESHNTQKLDIHWNQLGAYTEYYELEKALAQHCPTLEEKKIIKIPYNHGDLAQFIGFNHGRLQKICYKLDNERENIRA